MSLRYKVQYQEGELVTVGIIERDYSTSLKVIAEELRQNGENPLSITQYFICEDAQEKNGKFYIKMDATPKIKAGKLLSWTANGELCYGAVESIHGLVIEVYQPNDKESFICPKAGEEIFIRTVESSDIWL